MAIPLTFLMLLIFSLFLKEFGANYDSSSIVRQPLMPVVFTRFIQIRPKTWTEDCALRVEFYGHHEGKT